MANVRYTHFVGDNENDGPSPRRHSLVWFGVVLVDETLSTYFEGKMCPVSNEYVPEALAVTGLTREETLSFPSPLLVMPQFVDWVSAHTKQGTRPMYWSDNNGFDMGSLSAYLHEYTSGDPFGHTSRTLNDRYRGLMAGRKAAGIIDPPKICSSFKHLITIPHDHNPVNDARGNAQALLGMRQYGLELDV